MNYLFVIAVIALPLFIILAYALRYTFRLQKRQQRRARILDSLREQAPAEFRETDHFCGQDCRSALLADRHAGMFLLWETTLYRADAIRAVE